jgi:hypothetical protein
MEPELPEATTALVVISVDSAEATRTKPSPSTTACARSVSDGRREIGLSRASGRSISRQSRQ